MQRRKSGFARMSKAEARRFMRNVKRLLDGLPEPSPVPREAGQELANDPGYPVTVTEPSSGGESAAIPSSKST